MRSPSVLAAVGLSLALLAPAGAAACGNSYVQYYVLSGARAALDGAERALARGAPSEALRAAHEVAVAAAEGTPVRAFNRAVRDVVGPNNRAWHVSVNEDELSGEAPPAAAPAADGQALLARARLLRGIAIARMDGQLNSALTPLRRATAAQREARFQFALEDIAAALQAAPDDPRALAYRAEARARRDPSGSAEALATLRDLGRRDLLADPHSWAMLARLEDTPDARAQALTRCAALAGRNASRACAP